MRIHGSAAYSYMAVQLIVTWVSNDYLSTYWCTINMSYVNSCIMYHKDGISLVLIVKDAYVSPKPTVPSVSIQ